MLVLTRNPKSDVAIALEALGAELLQVNGIIPAGTLKGMDVLVNVLGDGVPPSESDARFKEAAASGVKVYFPSEFGPLVSLLNTLIIRNACPPS